MKNVKRIDFRVKIKGNGVVNYDDKDQKWVMNNFKSETTPKHQHRLSYYENNITYAKKNFYIENGELLYKLKLSEGFLANAMFKDDYVAQNPNILIHHPHLLFPYIASPASLLRGYMFPIENGNSINRKSAFSFPGAEQSNSAVSFIETFSRSGQKESGGDKADNTFFKKESIGEIEYTGEGSINLAELQFVSCDQQYDRFSFNPDMFELYTKYLKMKMPNFKSELGYYQLKTSCIMIPEWGFKFSNENVIFLAKEFLKKLYKINVFKRSGQIQIEELQFKLINDVIDDIDNREDGWVKVQSFKDIDKLTFETEEFYTLQNEEDIKKMKSEVEETKKKSKEKNEKISQDKNDKKASLKKTSKK